MFRVYLKYLLAEYFYENPNSIIYARDLVVKITRELENHIRNGRMIDISLKNVESEVIKLISGWLWSGVVTQRIVFDKLTFKLQNYGIIESVVKSYERNYPRLKELKLSF